MKANIKNKIISAVFFVLSAAIVFAVYYSVKYSFMDRKTVRPASQIELGTVQELLTGGSIDLSDYDGSPLALADSDLIALKGRGNVIMHFWASWCEPCIQEIPELIAFAKKASSGQLDVKIILVNMDYSQEDIQKFLRSFPELKSDIFVQVWDKDSRLSAAINITKLPATIIFKDQAKPVYIFGVTDWKSLSLK